MPIKVSCESCFVDLKVSDQYAGTKVKCKSCGEGIVVPIPLRKVQQVDSRHDEPDPWEDVDLNDAEDESATNELPSPRRRGRSGKSGKKRAARSSGKWSDPQNLIRNPIAIILGLEVITALPGMISQTCTMLYTLFWIIPAIFILMLSMVGGVLAAVVLNPTAMASSLIVGKTVTNHLIQKGSIQVQEKSPVYDFIMKCLLTSCAVALLGGVMLTLQMLCSGLVLGVGQH